MNENNEHHASLGTHRALLETHQHNRKCNTYVANARLLHWEVFKLQNDCKCNMYVVTLALLFCSRSNQAIRAPIK